MIKKNLLWLLIFLTSFLSAKTLLGKNFKKDLEEDLKKDLLGKINPKTHEDFILVNKKYTHNREIYLRKEAYQAFLAMAKAAKKENIYFKIISGFRSFNHQKYIWEAKWTGKRNSGNTNFLKSYPNANSRAKAILRYSSMPGTSRHHWGTDIDLNSLENSYFETAKGKKIYQWLLNNAHKYGFCQPYTPKNALRPYGYEEEKWHWSYLPIAKPFLTSYVKKQLGKNMHGFLGSKTTKNIDIEKHYILGINPQCQ